MSYFSLLTLFSKLQLENPEGESRTWEQGAGEITEYLKELGYAHA